MGKVSKIKNIGNFASKVIQKAFPMVKKRLTEGDLKPKVKASNAGSLYLNKGKGEIGNKINKSVTTYRGINPGSRSNLGKSKVEVTNITDTTPTKLPKDFDVPPMMRNYPKKNMGGKINGYKHGGRTCRGGGKATQGTGFKGTY